MEKHKTEEHKHHDAKEKEHRHHKTEEHKHHEAKGNPNIKLWVMVVALGLLIVVSGVQAIELASLKNQIEDADLSGLSTSISSPSSGGSGSSGADLQKNIASLPSMVGGC